MPTFTQDFICLHTFTPGFLCSPQRTNGHMCLYMCSHISHVYTLHLYNKQNIYFTVVLMTRKRHPNSYLRDFHICVQCILIAFIPTLPPTLFRWNISSLLTFCPLHFFNPKVQFMLPTYHEFEAIYWRMVDLLVTAPLKKIVPPFSRSPRLWTASQLGVRTVSTGFILCRFCLVHPSVVSWRCYVPLFPSLLIL